MDDDDKGCPDDQDGCEWVFLLVPAYLGCPGPKAVKRLCVCVCVCVMISGERQKVKQKAVRWPRVACSKGVGSNSLQSTSCQKWVHKKCSGIK